MSSSGNKPSSFSFWQSLKALPRWVKLWLILLGSINVASLVFITQPRGWLVCLFVFTGIAASKVAVSYGGGLTRLVGVGHIAGWVPLIIMLIFARPDANGAYSIYLNTLLIANTISLIFDFNDFRLWLGGDRQVIEHNQSR